MLSSIILFSLQTEKYAQECDLHTDKQIIIHSELREVQAKDAEKQYAKRDNIFFFF